MSSASLPRPLNRGEFYCHRCQKFVLLADHAKHQKEHIEHSQTKAQPDAEEQQ